MSTITLDPHAQPLTHPLPPCDKFIDLGGYRLCLQLLSTGEPTVILEPGAGGFSPVWSLVQPAVAQFARVVAYDRAGYARSDASPVSTPRTADQTVLELHRLLHNADLQPPYILVDHSFGGFVTRLFAHRFPDEVADLVLVDADHEDEWT